MTIKSSFDRTRRFAPGIALAALAGLGLAVPSAAATSATSSHTAAAPKPTIVLVHGAWADASSFAPVTKRLQQDGYTVLNAPNPLRGLDTDAANVAAFINQATTGPVVLVGHSYGGAVITNAAVATPTVKALVYVDAYAPAVGESVLDLTGAQPGSALAVRDPTTVFTFVQYDGATGGDVDVYLKPNLFKGIAAAALPASKANVLAASQSPVALGALKAGTTAAAWTQIKSYFFIGTNDKVLPPAEQRAMAERAHGVTVERKADHLSMLEAPKEITALIETAAKAE